jgi:hypothetical protein
MGAVISRWKVDVISWKKTKCGLLHFQCINLPQGVEHLQYALSLEAVRTNRLALSE